MINQNGSFEAIVQQALTITDSVARARYLLDSCGADSALHQRVAERLCSECGAPGELDETTSGSPPERALAGVPQVGEQVGPYLLVEEIGEGGMGIVFLAQQTQPIARRVALKVIKLGMDTRRVVSRFETERQTMSLMDHPCITKVLDAGATDTGRPYFVMELVQGKPITEYCDRRRLAIRRRLEIFAQVCNAIEHAHQKGIIHRDIKPSNILVTENDGVPLPKIIDFGIAKAVSNNPASEQTDVTRFGEMVGTPLYMSPEQANEDDVDTRSDIYSLGVVLYELITGTTPFYNLKNSGRRQIREAIGAGDPPTASSRISTLGDTVREVCENRETDFNALRRSVRGELDWILSKCLRRDRNQRYQSAGELAREIRRYLNGEALDVAAPTFWYRSRKFVAQHRAAVAASAAVLLLLGFVSVFSTWMAVRANSLAQRATQAERLAMERLTDVEKQRDRAQAAERRLAQLERQQRNLVAIHEATAQFNTERLKKLFAEMGEAGADHLPGDVQFVPLPSVLKSAFAPEPERPANLRQLPAMPDAEPPVNAQTYSLASKPPDLPLSCWQEGAQCDDVMVVVPAGAEDCEVDMLKSILAEQRAAFGKDDIVVAATLQQLGTLMSHRKEWAESSQYFAEAIDILERTSRDNPQWAELRDSITRLVEGNVGLSEALGELKSARKTLESEAFQDSVRSVIEKISDKVKNSKENE